jgi:hypothetical protein
MPIPRASGSTAIMYTYASPFSTLWRSHGMPCNDFHHFWTFVIGLSDSGFTLSHSHGDSHGYTAAEKLGIQEILLHTTQVRKVFLLHDFDCNYGWHGSDIVQVWMGIVFLERGAVTHKENESGEQISVGFKSALLLHYTFQEPRVKRHY